MLQCLYLTWVGHTEMLGQEKVWTMSGKVLKKSGNWFSKLRRNPVSMTWWRLCKRSHFQFPAALTSPHDQLHCENYEMVDMVGILVFGLNSFIYFCSLNRFPAWHLISSEAPCRLCN